MQDPFKYLFAWLIPLCLLGLTSYFSLFFFLAFDIDLVSLGWEAMTGQSPIHGAALLFGIVDLIIGIILLCHFIRSTRSRRYRKSQRHGAAGL